MSVLAWWLGMALAQEPAVVVVEDQGRRVRVSAQDAMPSLDKTTWMWLRPRHHRLPVNVHLPADYNAYALEWGELRLGIGSINVGVLPRTQLGTVPLLDALHVYNAQLKVNALRLGPVDIAATASHYRLPLGDFTGAWTGVGGGASLRIARAWSVHAGANWTHITGRGVPDASKLPRVLGTVSGSDVSSWRYPEQLGPLDIRSNAVAVRAASDVRFNRRDSLILEGRAIVWSRSSTSLPIALPPILGLDQVLERQGRVPLKDSYVTTLSYQANLRNLEIRLGVGLSAAKWAWLLQSTEIAWHFGGRTRWKEGKAMRTWRRNAKDLDSAPLQVVDDASVPFTVTTTTQ